MCGFTLYCKCECEGARADNKKGGGGVGEVGEKNWGKVDVDVVVKHFIPKRGAGVSAEWLRTGLQDVGNDPRSISSQQQSFGHEQPQATSGRRPTAAEDDNKHGYWSESTGSDVD